MKIIISAKGNSGLESKMDTRFGRADYFAIVDTTDNSIKFISNEAKNTSSGAGVKATQTVIDKDVDVLISANIGPKAFKGLTKTDIKLYSADSKAIERVIADYQVGKLEELDSPTNSSHSGLK